MRRHFCYSAKQIVSTDHHSFYTNSIELEEGYQNSLAQIVHNLEEADTLNPLYQSAVNTHVHEMISNYLHMGHSVRPSRIRFIQTMKAQLQSLIKLKASTSTCWYDLYHLAKFPYTRFLSFIGESRSVQEIA